jgi:hypothetical protein
MDSDRVTRNREALLLENAALRAEVAALREQLRRLRSRGRLDGLSGAAARVTTGMAPAITSEQVREWLEGLARQSGWTRLRAEALRTLITARRGSDARGELEDELDRHAPGLGSDLRRALRAHTGKGKHAVRAAFARYGPRAAEWLSADPRRVVADLLADLEELESRQHRQAPPRSAPAGSDRHADLAILGLGPGASLREVKAAHRRLVKRHHPDVGGDAATFRHIDAAYRRLIA